MIKIVDEIPTEIEKKSTKRSMILQDLTNAYESGIDKFELVEYGEAKSLAGYAYQISKEIGMKIMRKKVIEKYENGKTAWIYTNIHLIYQMFPLFTISRMKDGDSFRVFVKINRENIQAFLDEFDRRKKIR